MILVVKTISFLTGTRADFGKLKSLIKVCQKSSKFNTNVVVTGMHLQKKYGETIDEIYKSNIKNIFSFKNHQQSKMDITLAETIKGISMHIEEQAPDLIIVHGDRVEALAGAISGTLNNTLVAHIEGGELSGTVDEIIRHAVSKMSHIHFVSNDEAKKRLVQLGELEENIFVIGSPDLDLMNPAYLPSIQDVKGYYDISFADYAIAMYHPVTTELDRLEDNIKIFLEALVKSSKNYILIYPNNDLGTDIIISEILKYKKNNHFLIYPSLRFEYFLTLLKNADFIIGNSSAAIREAPFYGIPSINIGSRQHRRARSKTIINCKHNLQNILDSITKINHINKEKSEIDTNFFGDGSSDKQFLEAISNKDFWKISKQKYFQDIS